MPKVGRVGARSRRAVAESITSSASAGPAGPGFSPPMSVSRGRYEAQLLGLDRERGRSRRYRLERYSSRYSRERHSPRCRKLGSLAGDRGRSRRRRCIADLDRHIDFVRDRVSRHRRRAGGGYGFHVRARRRSGIYNAGIEPDFVGPALALKVSDDGPGLIVDDQFARVGELVIRAERDARSPAQPVVFHGALEKSATIFSTWNGAVPEILRVKLGRGVAKVAAPVFGMLI
jgi:hypothetical protein